MKVCQKAPKSNQLSHEK